MGLLFIKHASLHYNIDILLLIHSFLRSSIRVSKCAFLSNRKKGAARTVDYCVELLLFVLVLCKTRLPPTTETERRLIKSFNFKDSHQSLYA